MTDRISIYFEDEYHSEQRSIQMEHWDADADGISILDLSSDRHKCGVLRISGSVSQLEELRKAIDEAIEYISFGGDCNGASRRP